MKTNGLARDVYLLLARSASLRAGLRRAEGTIYFRYPALAPSARKRASGRAGLTCGRAYGAGASMAQNIWQLTRSFVVE